jgi:hypothetical protein
MDKFLKLKRPAPAEQSTCSVSANSVSDSVISDDDTEVDSVNVAGPSAAKKTPTGPNRRYDESYLKFGFIATGSDDQQKPQCVICSEVLSSASMKPSKLKRHQQTKHSETVKKPIEFFQRKRDDLLKQKSRFIKSATFNSSALKASFEVALRIAKAKKPHTIAEDLILPSAVDMVKAVLGEKVVRQVRAIPLSDNSISRRITDMSADVNEQIVEMLKTSKKFALQLDESTDVANCAILIGLCTFC